MSGGVSAMSQACVFGKQGKFIPISTCVEQLAYSGQEISGLTDTGADISVISRSCV